MEFINTINFHREHNQQTLSEHYQNLRLQLSKNVIDRKIVYFDTKFWVLLRNSFLYPKLNADTDKLLTLSLSLVEDKKCTFPISENIFIEIMKQTDDKTRQATIQLIDTLSNGVTFINYDERFKLEVLHFLDSMNGRSIYPIERLIWTKMAYVMGARSYYHPSISIDENLILQKAFVDYSWSITMQEMVETMQNNAPNISQYFNIKFNNINTLNEGKFSEAG